MEEINAGWTGKPLQRLLAGWRLYKRCRIQSEILNVQTFHCMLVAKGN